MSPDCDTDTTPHDDGRDPKGLSTGHDEDETVLSGSDNRLKNVDLLDYANSIAPLRGLGYRIYVNQPYVDQFIDSLQTTLMTHRKQVNYREVS